MMSLGGDVVADVMQHRRILQQAAVFLAEAMQRFGTIDVVLNNAGVRQRDLYPPHGFTTILETDVADWQRMFEVNVMSGVRLTRHYLQRMLEEKTWGRVVFVSSESAVFVPKEMVHYGFSKAAQLVIARGAAEMTKGTNVTVNSVLPGPTWVEMAPVRLAARAKGLGWFKDEHDEAPAAVLTDLPADAVARLGDELLRARDGQFVLGRRVPAEEAVKWKPREYARAARETFHLLAPLYRLR